MVDPLESVKSKLLLFHQSVERFFEERKKEATWAKAATSIIIPFFIFPLVIYGFGILSSENLMDWTATKPAYIGSLGGYTLLLFVLIVGIVASYLFVSKSLYKIKLNWTSSVYVFGIGVMGIFGVGLTINLFLVFLESFKNSLADFLVLILINIKDFFSLYLLLISLRTMTGVGYAKVVGAVVVSIFIFGVVGSILAMVYYNLIVVPSISDGNYDPDYEYYFNVSEREDGTMNASQVQIYDSGETKQACYIEFPKGWKQINEFQLEGISSRLDYTLYNASLDDLFYNSNKPNVSEFIYFQHGFFKITPFSKCSAEQTLPYWIDDWPEFGGKAEARVVEISSDYRICYHSALNLNKTIIRHAFYGAFDRYRSGFSGVYESPYGQDQDLYYIMANISCNMGY